MEVRPGIVQQHPTQHSNWRGQLLLLPSPASHARMLLGNAVNGDNSQLSHEFGTCLSAGHADVPRPIDRFVALPLYPTEAAIIDAVRPERRVSFGPPDQLHHFNSATYFMQQQYRSPEPSQMLLNTSILRTPPIYST